MLGALQEKSIKPAASFIDVLHNVMIDANYLKGSEPTDSGWDFSNWPERSFREFKGWVIAEKYFQIADIKGRMLPLRIVEIDPKQFSVEDVAISFVIKPVTAKGFPTILIGKDNLGNERILRNSHEPLWRHQIPDCFQDLAKQVGTAGLIKQNKVAPDKQGSEWALFLKDILQNKRVFPTDYQITDFMVRDRLELGPDNRYTDRDALFAEMEITQEEMLMVGAADFIIS